jgi:hypothetical protein
VKATAELRYVSTNVAADVSVTENYSFLLFNEQAPQLVLSSTPVIYREDGLNAFYLFVPAKTNFGYANPFVDDLLEGVISPSVSLSASGVTSFESFDVNSNKDQFITVNVPAVNSGATSFTEAVANVSYNFYLNGVSTEVATPEEIAINSRTIDVVTSSAIVIQSGALSQFNVASGLYSGLVATGIDQILLEIGSGIWKPGLSIASYSGLRAADSGLFEVETDTDLQGATFTRLSDTQLLITLSGTLASDDLPQITIHPAAYRQTLAAPAVKGWADVEAPTGADQFASSGLDNLIYIKLSSGVFASVINSGSFVFSGVTPNSTYIMNSGTFTRISDTEVTIVPGSGLVFAAASAQALTLGSGAFVQSLPGTPEIDVVSSFVPIVGANAGWSATVKGVIVQGSGSITITPGNGLLINPNITQSDIIFSGLNAAVFQSANIRVDGNTIIVSGFTNLDAAAAKYDIILRRSAFIKGNFADARSNAPTITVS